MFGGSIINAMVHTTDGITHNLQDVTHAVDAGSIIKKNLGYISNKVQDAAGGITNKVQEVTNSLTDVVEAVGGLTNGITNIISEGFIASKMLILIMTKILPIATTLIANPTNIIGFILEIIVPAGIRESRIFVLIRTKIFPLAATVVEDIAKIIGNIIVSRTIAPKV